MINMAKKKKTKTCTVNKCKERYLAKGYCGKHYERWRTTGNPNTISRSRPKQKYRDLLAVVNKIDWARLAAFIDGEGTIHIASNGQVPKHLGLKVAISNTDPRLLAWLKERFGGSVSFLKSRSDKWKDAYVWTASSAHAEEILKKCKKYLIIKGEQANLALAFRKTFRLGRNQHQELSIKERKVREGFKSKITVLNKRGNING